MKNKLLLFSLLIFIVNNTFGQRYKDQIFDEVSKETVTYLENKGLEMDIYQATDDEISNRPVILFVHGGGFGGGARDEPEIMDFCKNMARRGIVAISMTYTLTMKGQSFSCDQAAESKMATFKSVALEIAEATNYILRNQEKLNIDPNRIVLVGSSAGAEAVLHAAFWKETQVNLPNEFKYGGLISMAGALADLSWINEKSVIPMQFFHGTCDDLVPYGSSSHHYCDQEEVGYLILHGPGSIVEKLKKMNRGYYLVTGCDDNHAWAGRPFKKYRSEIADFVMNDVLLGKTRQIHQIIPAETACKIEGAPVCGE